MDSTPSIAPELDSLQRSRLIRQLSYTLDIHHVDSITHSLLWLSDIKALEKLLSQASNPEHRYLVFGNLKAPRRCKKVMNNWLARPEKIDSVINPVIDPESDRMALPIAHVKILGSLYDASKSGLVSDLELRPPVESSQTPQKRTPEKRKLTGTARTSNKTPRRTSSAGQGPSAAKGTVIRSKSAKDVARARDQERCAIVQMGEPIEIAHIYPFAMQQKPLDERNNFWSLLALFWSRETIAKWQQHIIGPDGTEVPSNLLCLWKSVHGLWSEARFALEPIEMSKDKTSLEMRFWWLPRRDFAKSVRLSARPSLPSNLDEGPFNVKLWDSDTEKRIRSGHTVTMTTPDPESMPLPAFELLHMQWILNRVAAMSGAPDALESDEEDEEEFEYYGGTWVR